MGIDVVLGTAQLGGAYGIANRGGQPSRRSAIALLQEASRHGVAAFDTAPRYGDAETLIGEAETHTAVFTKVSGVDVSGSVSASLERLQRDQVDVLFLHDAAVLLEDPDGVIGMAERLVGCRVDALGVSTYTPEEFEAALSDGRFTHVQVPISVADRRLVASGALERAVDQGIRVYARSVLLQGSLLMEEEMLPFHLRDLVPMRRRLVSIARALGIGLHDLLLRFIGSLPLTGVLVGCDNVEQLLEDLRSLDSAPLDEDLMAELLSLPQPEDRIVDPRAWPTP